jgi:hypothetical protein
MTDREHAKALYVAASSLVGLLIRSESRFTYDEWWRLHELHRVVNEYERLNQLGYT